MQVLNSKVLQTYKNEIENILNSYIIVKENVEGYSFYLEKKNNLITFYKKYSNQPITEYDLIYYKYYNDIIDHFKKVITLDVFKKIENNYLFKFKYLPSCPNCENYKLLLTFIKDLKKDTIIENNKYIYSYEYWSNLFQTDYLPIIFEGYLNEDQKRKIREYIETSYDILNAKYGKVDFMEFFIDTINPNYKYESIYKNKNEFIRGINIYVKNKNNYYNYVILNPMVEEIITANKTENPIVMHIILSDILEFISIYLFKNKNSIKIKSSDNKDKFIELLCKIFNEYIIRKISKYSENELSIFKNKYLNLFFNEKLKVNDSYIKNEETIKFLKEKDEYNIIFQIFLDIFRKKKKLIKFLDNNFLEFEEYVVNTFYNILDINQEEVDFEKIVLTFEKD